VHEALFCAPCFMPAPTQWHTAHTLLQKAHAGSERFYAICLRREQMKKRAKAHAKIYTPKCHKIYARHASACTWRGAKPPCCRRQKEQLCCTLRKHAMLATLKVAVSLCDALACAGSVGYVQVHHHRRTVCRSTACSTVHEDAARVLQNGSVCFPSSSR